MSEKNVFCYLMVAPALVITLILGIYPMIRSMVMSFRSYDLLNQDKNGWVGLDNYRQVMADDRFVQTINQTVVFTFVAIFFVVVIALFLAQVINAEFRGRAVLRTLIFTPWFVPPVVASAIWIWLLNANVSPINHFLLEAGVIERKIRFLTDSDTWGPFSIPMMSIIAVRVWNGLPIAIVFILAGLQSIPKSLYEAADMDGAGTFSKFFHVTLPLLRPVLLVLLALFFMNGFGHFEMNYVMTGGGPRNLTNVLAVWTYQEGFQFLRFDRAAAAGGIVLMMTSVVAVLYIWLQAKDVRK
ncbi:carbohydrate ABC transporter permease [Jannaschia marina]|uniref:carbohydrate ABC transporter permease n=1 Tax=Jannaschia marina TaxID=2741674 RepID=UPI0015CE4996|nr:sugar ABC transporter permease [Jannaschia marina]